MSNAEFGSLTIFLFLLLAAARLCGFLFARLHQPKVVGEILAGVLLGPSLMGRLTHVLPATSITGSGTPAASVLFFLYNFGLLLLMFASGAETKGLFHREDRRQVAWLGALGTGLPFVAALCGMPFFSLSSFAGRIHTHLPLMLVVSIAVAVTSIPVISKIFHDLGILHTRFSRLVLGVAVLEDIVLWTLLAIATALAQSGTVPHSTIATHVVLTVVYFAFGLFAAPRLLFRINRLRWNVLIVNSPIAYAIVVLLAYTAVASLLDINLVFAAFLAGYAVIADRELMSSAISSISDIAFAVFIPIYFAIVGYRIDLGRSFSLSMVVVFLLISSAAKFFSAGVGARVAGFNFKDSINLAAALNARGGPGIVLATVAYDAGIINATFCTTLIVVAILTSQAAGAWLAYILRSGEPLLSPQSATPAAGAQDVVATA
jgi:Kef-type K+ transport system membrane component KefB